MKKSLKPAMLLILTVLTMILLSGCGTNDKMTIDKVDIMAKIMLDGDLYVEELFTYTVRGEYETVPRYMDNFGDANIEFFEAYAPPNDRTLGNIGYENLERYPVALRVKRGTYFIELQAKEETRQVYYRYRLDSEAVKYNDRGELDWSVLEDNSQDHHNVTITVYTEQPAKEAMSGFAYDRSGGGITEETNQLVRYENDLLPEGDTVRLKMYFPPEVLTDLEATEQSSATLSEQLSAEEKLQQKFAEREQLLEAGRHISRWLIYIAAAGVIFYAFSLRRIAAWWSGRRISFEELVDMDPVNLIYYYRRGNLRLADALAGVYSLCLVDKLSISMVQSGVRFQEDREAPKRCPQFTFKGNRTGLNKTERYLRSWLFHGTAVLNLETISGPTKTERKQEQAMRKYKKRAKSLKKSLSRWQELVAAENNGTIKQREYTPRKVILPVLALIHLALLIYLYIADAVPWGWIIVLAAVLGGGVAWASIRWRHKGFMIAYLIACFFVGAQIMYDPVVETYLDFVMLSIVLVVLLPGRALDPNSEAYRSAVKRYRRRLARGKTDEVDDLHRLEPMLYAALLLGVGRSFIRSVQKEHGDSVLSPISPLTQPEAIAAMDYALKLSWRGMPVDSSSRRGSSSDSGSGDGGSWFEGSSDCGSDGGSGDGGGGGGD